MTDHPAPAHLSARLPNLIVVGAMKAGTSALHRALGRHPQVAMSEPKELNFFFGPAHGDRSGDWSPQGNWHRGLEWYAGHFPSAAPVRGESSPGYTSPDHAEAPARMAAVLPGAHLVYLVRDPIARAVSQYRHHRRDGAERRPMAEALLDPASQYLSRSRYAERVAPYLRCYPRAQLTVIVSERLRHAPRQTLTALFGSLGIDETVWDPAMSGQEHTAGGPAPPLDARLAGALAERLADDVERLRELAADDLDDWSI